MNAHDLIKIYQNSVVDRTNHLTRWDEIAYYGMPNARGFNYTVTEGQQITEEIFDHTMMRAGWDMAMAFNTLLTSPFIDWFETRFIQPELNQVDELVQISQRNTNVMRSYLQASNFYEQMNTAWMSLVFFGGQCIDGDESAYSRESGGGFKGLTFRSRNIGDVVIAENADGDVDYAALELELTAWQAVQKYGSDKVSDKVRGQIEANEPNEKSKYLNIAMRRRDDNGQPVPHTVGNKMVAEEKMPYAMVDLDLEQKEIIREQGSMEMPRLYGRYLLGPNSVYGFGPGHVAAPMAYTLNRAIGLSFGEWEKAVDPNYVTDEFNVVSDVDIGAGGITQVRDIDRIRKEQIGGQGSYERFKRDEARQFIREVFLTDKLDLPPRTETGEMTKYEVAKRLEKAAQFIGPPIARQQKAVLTPLLRRVFNILWRAGKLEALPDGIDSRIDIHYVGPLARAQTYSDLEAAERWEAGIVEYAANTGDASRLDIIDTLGMDRMRADRLGVPAEAVSSDEQVKKTRAKRAKDEERQRQVDQGEQMASAAQKASQSGVPAEQIALATAG